MTGKGKHGFVPIEALRSAQQTHTDWGTSTEERFQASEQSEVFDETGVAVSDASRRRFLSLMAGSMALAGLTGCTRQPAEPIMPYVEQPENVVPGNPKYYATAVPVNGVAEGV